MTSQIWYLEVDGISGSVDIVFVLSTAGSADDVGVNEVGGRQEDLNDKG